jgi:hypothetical protein
MRSELGVLDAGLPSNVDVRLGERRGKSWTRLTPLDAQPDPDNIVNRREDRRSAYCRSPPRRFANWDAWNARSLPRRGSGQELNKGESRNSLARAVLIHRRGEHRSTHLRPQSRRLRDHSLEHSVVERAVDLLRKFEDVPDSLLAHRSPIGWEHVNLTAEYIWGVDRRNTAPSYSVASWALVMRDGGGARVPPSNEPRRYCRSAYSP